jgi:DNA invertase Pin-like site-specific DNA recombinase
MIAADAVHPLVTTAHRAKQACVYVRQSSLSQVTRHGESTDLQYHLVDRAVLLGWPRERVITIDDDLGKSGASADRRLGFQRLIAEIGLAHVGLVLSMDASRLARNNSDWYQLIELCSVFGTLIADTERVYDPRTYHDRLLLGLSGMMSEAELHHLRQRLQAGEWNKAARGDLRLPLPVGLIRLPGGEVTLHPDEEVQVRMRLVFERFRTLGTAAAVVRSLRRDDLPLPVRPLRGPAPHPVTWQPARSSMVLGILKNPAYAGTYVYGRLTYDPARRQPGRPSTGIVHRPIEDWPIVIHNHHPAYISWDDFLVNQAQLTANQSSYLKPARGAPRKGQALLQGIAICGCCGAHMGLRYSGPRGDFPVYACVRSQREEGAERCQEVRALGLDTEIERLVLEALAPDTIGLAVAALEQLEQEDVALRRQWQLRIERARYEAERAHRQYDAVEPENRLVARSLERQWEEKLRALEQVERDGETHLRRHRLLLTPDDRQTILALADDLPALWHAPDTTPVERKQILRLIVKEVILDQRRARGKVWFQINWQTGAITDHWLVRHVRAYPEHAELEALQDRVRALNAEQKLDEAIAEVLNREGFHTAHGRPFSGKIIWILRKRWGIATVNPESTPDRWPDGSYSMRGAAAAIGVIPGTIFHWLHSGVLRGEQIAKGLPWKIPLTDDQIAALRARVARTRRLPRRAS